MTERALRREMGFYDVVALGISAALGVSIFSVIAPATAVAGPAMLVALALAAIPMVIFAVVYAFLSSADPRTGASFYWPAQYVHPYVGFIVCWLRILGCAGALNILGTVFASYWNTFWSVPAPIVSVLVLTVFFLLNLLTVAVAGGVARILTLAKLVVFCAFIAVGTTHVDADHFQPFFSEGALGVLVALPLLMGLFGGIESATEAGEEVRNPERTIGRGLATATIVSVVIYLGVSLVVIGVLNQRVTAASGAPLSQAAALFGGGWASVMLALALVSIAAAVNAQFLMFARFIFAMAKAGALPRVLTSVDRRRGAPWAAVTAVYVCALVSHLLPDGLIFLFLAANLPTVMKYMTNCGSAIGLVRRRPDLHQAAAFRLSENAVRTWAICGMVASAVMLVAGLAADWRAYVALAVWGAIGSVYWLVRSRLGLLGEAVATEPADGPVIPMTGA